MPRIDAQLNRRVRLLAGVLHLRPERQDASGANVQRHDGQGRAPEHSLASFESASCPKVIPVGIGRQVDRAIDGASLRDGRRHHRRSQHELVVDIEAVGIG